ncbi:MAG TPA: ABC transporter substrate-binding protein [Anaeromyxobacteraceae bacterium]|nr:ABC transporter substrate-binding protein [Anaeromyxobacteraceae bacterium]
MNHRLCRSLALALVLAPVAWSSGKARAAEGRVRLAYLQNDLHHLALWVALEKGFFREEGVSVDIAGVFHTGAEMMSAFEGGDLDMAYVGQAPATIAEARGRVRLRVVALVNAEGSAVVVGAGAPYRRLGDLRGATVAMPGYGSVQDVLLRKAMAEEGLGPHDLKVIVLKPPEMISALGSGDIRGFIAWEPYPTRARAQGVGRILVASHAIWAGHPCCILVAAQAFAEAHRALVEAVRRVHVRATGYLRAHPEEAAAVAVRYTGMDEATVRDAMKDVIYADELSVEAEREMVRSLVEQQYIPPVDPADFLRRFLLDTESLAP